MRLMLKRPLTDLWLDLEAEATSITVTPALSAPGDITVTLPMDYLAKKGEDGQPILSKYETLMIVEHDDESLSVALVDDIQLQDEELTVSGGGLSMLTKGTPWLGEDKKYELADPLSIYRDIWNHIQSFDGGKVGLKLTGSTETTGTLGTPDSPAYAKAKADVDFIQSEVTRAETVLKTRESTLTNSVAGVFKAVGLHTVGQIKLQKSRPSETKNIVWVDSDDYNKAYIYSAGQWVLKSGAASAVSTYLEARKQRDNTKNYLAGQRSKLTAAKEVLSEVEDGKGEAYELNWYTTHDLSQVVDELIDAGPFEYVERAKWDGDNVELSLEIGAPRIGSRKPDLRFELGVNVLNQPTLDLRDPYTEVFQMGAGEGSETLRTIRTLPKSGRVRRVQVATDKDARTQQTTNRAADKALNKVRTTTGFLIDSLEVVDHPFAYRSQYGVGDEINVIGVLPDGSELDVWVRIREITFSGDDDIIDLKVEAL